MRAYALHRFFYRVFHASSRWQRAARARRRGRVRWARWGLIALLLVVVGASIVVGRSIYQTLDLPRRTVGSNRPEPARQLEEARPLAPASKAETVPPATRPVPPSSPPPMRVVTTTARRAKE